MVIQIPHLAADNEVVPPTQPEPLPVDPRRYSKKAAVEGRAFQETGCWNDGSTGLFVTGNIW